MESLYNTLETVNSQHSTWIEKREKTLSLPRTTNTLEPRLYALYQQIEIELSEVKHKAIEIISSVHGEGTTSFVVKFGKFLADQLHLKVLLIDANRFQPSLSQKLGAQVNLGWDEMMANQEGEWSAITQIDARSLYFSQLHVSARDHRFVKPEMFQRSLQTIKPSFDLILIDSPPVWNTAEIANNSFQADGTILLVEANSTRRDTVAKSVEFLHEHRSRLLGIVLNKRKYPIPHWMYKHL